MNSDLSKVNASMKLWQTSDGSLEVSTMSETLNSAIDLECDKTHSAPRYWICNFALLGDIRRRSSPITALGLLLRRAILSCRRIAWTSLCEIGRAHV